MATAHEQLREAIRRSGLSYEEIGRRIGVTGVAVGQWVRPENPATPKWMFRPAIERIFKIPAVEWLTEQERDALARGALASPSPDPEAA